MPEENIIFYDIETNSKFASYAELRLIGYQIGLTGKPEVIQYGKGDSREELFKEIVASPEWIKVDFNGINYDQIVLRRHGFPVNYVHSHDVYLMAKTINPMLPAYGLKFLNWFFYGDPHEPERRLHAFCKHRAIPMWDAPADLLEEYCAYDVVQTIRLYKLFLPYIQSSKHSHAYYSVELPMGPVLHEIILEGGDCINLTRVKNEIRSKEEEKVKLDLKAKELTEGRITNLASRKQVAKELSQIEDIELTTSDKGNLLLRKDDLLTLLDLDDPKNDISRIARLTYEVRHLNNQLGFLRAYRRATLYELRTCIARRNYRQTGSCRVPKSYSLSSARTRRILSSSRFGINFQNQNETGKAIQLIPTGWIGVYLDSTQIENIVHMWASSDYERIKDYSKEHNWSEYVWLANRIMGGNRTRKELEGIPSRTNPQWSIYKQFKTCKLALNFGMGTAKFAKTNGIDIESAKEMFTEIHRACPAIRDLQKRIQQTLSKRGYVQDPFGHVYSGSPNMAYKVVAYLIQGCGTGSVPKVMARAIWETLQTLPPRTAVMTGLTHDEIAFRLSKEMGAARIIDTLQQALYCMEEKFSDKFDGIPLRAKLSLSITTAKEAETIEHHGRPWGEVVDYIREKYLK